MGNFSYTIVDNFDHIIEERGNQVLALRKIKWGDNEKVNLDLRRWISTDEGERASKGVGFFDPDQGPAELINVLIDEGYGSTSVIMNHLSQRNDFAETITTVLGDTLTEEQIKKFSEVQFSSEHYDSSESLYDPRTELFDE